jgi:ABC-type phosphate/phosphonate transport system substrate-binding protein
MTTREVHEATFARGLGVVMVLFLVVASQQGPFAVEQPETERAMRYGFTAAVIGDANPQDVLAASLIWSRGVVAQTGFWTTVEANIFQDSTEAVASVNAGKIDLLALSTLEYLGVERTLQAEPGLVIQQSNETMTESVLLVRNDVTSLADLAGKRLAINLQSRDWDLSTVWLDVLLMEAGMPDRQKAFSAIKIVPKRSQAALALFFRQVDAAIETRSAFETAVELNPQLGKELKILATSPPFLSALICIRNSMGRDLRQRYIEKATRLHELPQFRQTFIVMRVTRISEWDPRFLDTARAMVGRRDALKKKAAAR